MAKPSFDLKKNKGILLFLIAFFIVGLILSLMRYPGSDESHYMRETALITHCIQNFQWFGNELVGIHGFLFKLPAALLFLITGPSVFVATFTNIIFGLLVIFLCYQIFLKVLDSREWALAGCFLVATNVFVLRVLPTYLREFPVMFAVLLLIYSVLNKKSDIWIAFSLLLMLDAKEGVFIILLPGVLLWLLISEFKSPDRGKYIQLLLRLFKRGLIFISPALLYVLLMLYTGLIPLNVMLTSYLGLNGGGFSTVVKYQVVNTESQYKYQIKNPNEELTDTSLQGEEKSGNLLSKLWGILLLYFHKILYFRTFSLTSLPRFIVLPALIFSILLFRKWFRQGDRERLLLPLLFWTYLLVYILRSSHGRYLLPITPVIMLFFILFLKDGLSQKILSRNVLGAVFIFVSLGLVFEAGFIPIKIGIYTVILSLFLILLRGRDIKRLPLNKLKWAFVLGIGFFTFCIQIASSYLLPGQIGKFIAWGYCGEMDKIAGQFKGDEPIWINTDSNLFKFFLRTDMIITFYEGRGDLELSAQVPKYHMINRDRRTDVFSLFNEESDFVQYLEINRIKKVGLLISNHKQDKYSFKKKELQKEFEKLPGLELDQQIPMKNKVLLIYILNYQ
ncbi:hypothetical protein ACFLT9_14005 [Acidobacteriota bacterium]